MKAQAKLHHAVAVRNEAKFEEKDREMLNEIEKISSVHVRQQLQELWRNDCKKQEEKSQNLWEVKKSWFKKFEGNGENIANSEDAAPTPPTNQDQRRGKRRNARQPPNRRRNNSRPRKNNQNFNNASDRNRDTANSRNSGNRVSQQRRKKGQQRNSIQNNRQQRSRPQERNSNRNSGNNRRVRNNNRTSKDNDRSTEEQNALQELREDSEILIFEADKGGAVVVMDRTYYADKILEMLNDSQTYEEITANKDKVVMKLMKELAGNHSHSLTEKEVNYLCHFDFKTSGFYGLPKIHKSKIICQEAKVQKKPYIRVLRPADLKFRPIVAGPRCPTSRLSNFVDILIKPFTLHVQSYLRDTIDFLNYLPRIVPESTILVSFDVTSLYTNINHELGVKAMEYWINKHPRSLNSRFSKEFIIDSILLILTNNTFTFDDRIFLQKKGTAMGTKMAPSYATLVLGYLENELYKLPFLDVMIRKDKTHLTTDIYYKPTDSFQYLPYTSSHPRHTKNNIPYNLARRICMIVENQDIRKRRLDDLKQILLRKQYPAEIIDYGVNKALTLTTEELRRVREQATENNLLCLVTTYNPNNPQVFQLVRRTLPMLNQNSSLKSIMSKTKVIHSQRQPRNLKRMLTNSYFSRLKDTDPEVKICGTKRCGTCPYLKQGKEFTFSATNETFRIKHSMNCTSTNLIYVITCAGCGHNYIGETGDVLRNRVTVHKQQIRDPH
ncbi:unnamed protein product, partial [Porites evermanni]